MPEKPFEQLGSRIREARRRAKLTQEALADRIEAQKNTISEIERGREPSLSVLGRIAAVLEVPIAELLEPQHPAGHPPAGEGGATHYEPRVTAPARVVEAVPAELAEVSGYAKAVLEMMHSMIGAQERVVAGLAPWARAHASVYAGLPTPNATPEELEAATARQLRLDAEAALARERAS